MIMRGDRLFLVCWENGDISAGFSSLYRARWYQCYKGERHRKPFHIRTVRVDTQIIPKGKFEYCYTYRIVNGVITQKYVAFDHHRKPWLEVGKAKDGTVEFRAKVFMRYDDDEGALEVAKRLEEERKTRPWYAYKGKYIH